MAVTPAIRFRRKYGRMGLTELGDGPPERALGVRQRAVLWRPEQCDKCGSREIFDDQLEPRRVYCFGCGADAFIVRGGWAST